MYLPKSALLGLLWLLGGVGALLTIPALLMGQVDPQIQHLATQDGLSHRWVFHILQDSRGVIWISTFDGLNRYDGNQFKSYYPSDGSNHPLAANRIRRVEETSDGMFLVNTAAGLFRFDPIHGQFTLLQRFQQGMVAFNFPGREEGRRHWVLSSIERGHGMQIAFYKYSEQELSTLQVVTKPTKEPMTLVDYTDNELWFWAAGGQYYRLETVTWQWHPLETKNPIGTDLPLDDQGRFWYLTPEKRALQSFSLPDDGNPTSWSSFIYADSSIWLFRQGEIQRIYRFDRAEASLEEVVASPDLDVDDRHNTFEANHLFVDRESNLWLGHFQGVLKIQPGRQLFTNYLALPFTGGQVPPVGVSARSMGEDREGNIFVIAENGLLYKISPQSGVGAQVHLQPRDAATGAAAAFAGSVANMQADPAGNLWIINENDNSLIKYDPVADICLNFPFPKSIPSARYVYVDRRGRVMISRNPQLYLFEENKGQFQKLPGISLGFPRRVTDPNPDVLWSFYEMGIIRADLAAGTSEKIKLYPTVRDQRCMVWCQDYLWLGTSKGLVKVDPQTFEITTYGRAQGLPGDFIYSILEGEDHLWLGTSDGLCHFNVLTEEVTNFGLKDGLPHFEFNSRSELKARNGRYYLGTLNGVTSFDPDELSARQRLKPRIIWSEFSCYDKRTDSLRFYSYGQLTPNEPIRIGPSITNFTFYLALDSYTRPDKNQYAWRMDGLDSDWNYPGHQPFALYHQLPPGQYVFRAKAADPFGNWSQNELSIPIQVLRPWTGRWWAWLLYLSLGGLLARTFYRFQLGRKLEQAENRRLRELDDFKSRFFANITHEFRTPLTVILGMSEDLLTGTRTEQAPPKLPQAQKKLGLIRRNGENLLRLINQILDLAKLESNNLRLNFVHGDALAYLRYITESLHSLANIKNIAIRLESAHEVIEMDYDPDRLLYIVHNLLSNAIKFTPAGGKVTLTASAITLNGQTDSSQMLKMQVKDTGIGIAPDELPKVFDRFYQAKNTSGNSMGSSGIGLSLTKEVVKALGGEITVESELGKGTSFTVLLPIRHEAATPATGSPATHSREDTHQHPIDSATVPALLAVEQPTLLIVEDNPDVVAYLSSCLEDTYQLQVAYDGQAGIDMALEQVPDIIISDVMMPEKDGFALVEALKHDTRTSHIPIVLLTARAEIESRLTGLRQGADAYLAKPFHREELSLTLIQLLENRRRLQVRYHQLQSGLPLPPLADPVQEREDAFILQLKSYYQEHLSNPALTLQDVCRAMAMGRTNLNRKLQALTGKSAMQLLRELRLHQARQLLLQTSRSISEIAVDVGFNDPKYFSRAFSDTYGHPPSQLR